MRKDTKRLKAGMRLVLRRAHRQGAISKEQMQEFLRDPDKLETLADMAAIEAGADEDDVTDEDVPWIIRVFKYLIENPEKLANLIQIISSLFAHQGSPE